MLVILSPTYSPDVCAQVLSKIWVIMACFCVLLMANPNFDKSRKKKTKRTKKKRKKKRTKKPKSLNRIDKN
jgi:hypothetical protein